MTNKKPTINLYDLTTNQIGLYHYIYSEHLRKFVEYIDPERGFSAKDLRIKARGRFQEILRYAQDNER